MTLNDALAALYHEHQGDAPCWHAQHTYPPDCEAFAERAARDPTFREAFTMALVEALHARNTDVAEIGGPCNHREVPPECVAEAQAIVARLLPGADRG